LRAITKKPGEASNHGGDLLDHPVSEVFLLWVSAHVLERQNRKRQLVGQRQGRFFGRRFCRLTAEPNRKHVHWPGDILDLPLAHVVEDEIELAADFIAYDPADANAAGLGQSLQAGGEIDPVAEYVAPVANDVAWCTPMRNSMRFSAGTSMLRSAMPRCISAAQRTALTTL